MTEFRAFFRAFGYAWEGVVFAFASQRNMKVHALMSCCAILISIVLNLSSLEWAVLFLTLALVISLEMVNTAIEAGMDSISTELDPKIKIAKDVAAGAVFISAFFALGVGACLWIPKLNLLMGT